MIWTCLGNVGSAYEVQPARCRAFRACRGLLPWTAKRHFVVGLTVSAPRAPTTVNSSSRRNGSRVRRLLPMNAATLAFWHGGCSYPGRVGVAEEPA
jgi:hypothetical protein